MNLTEHEKVMVSRLRQKHRAWLWKRWFLLAFGVVEASCGILLLRYAMDTQQLNDPHRLYITFESLILLSISIFFIGYPIVYWRGNPTRTVLLKLVDHCSQGEATK